MEFFSNVQSFLWTFLNLLLPLMVSIDWWELLWVLSFQWLVRQELIVSPTKRSLRHVILNDSNGVNILPECKSSTWQIAIRSLSLSPSLAPLGWELLWAGTEWASSSPCNEVTMEVSAAPRDTLRPLPLLPPSTWYIASLYDIHCLCPPCDQVMCIRYIVSGNWSLYTGSFDSVGIVKINTSLEGTHDATLLHWQNSPLQ